MLAGLTHILLEISVSEAAALWFSAGVASAFIGYLLWRARDGAVVLRAWGMRGDNFSLALRAQLVFGVGGATSIVAYAATQGSISLPWDFWLVLALYPLWGAAQQFALQNLIARNVEETHPTPVGSLRRGRSPVCCVAHPSLAAGRLDLRGRLLLYDDLPACAEPVGRRHCPRHPGFASRLPHIGRRSGSPTLGSRLRSVATRHPLCRLH